MQEKEREQRLIEALILGSAASFDELYEIYHNKVYSFSFRYLQDVHEAESLVQEVFFRLWSHREQLGEIKNLRAWLFTMTFNLIRQYFRDLAIERRGMQKYAESALFEHSPTLSTVEFNDLMEKAEAIIERLPRKQKTVLLLSIRDGLSSKEISEKLRINKRTVENHLSSARAFLKKVLKEENLITLLLCWILF